MTSNYPDGLNQAEFDRYWDERLDDEPVIDDTVHCCPECETPNQFGELCYRCEAEMRREGVA